MKRTIAILLHRRPELLERQINALLACQDLNHFSDLILSVDPGHKNSEDVEKAARAIMLAINEIDGLPKCTLVSYPKNLGIVEHPRQVLRLSFESIGSDLHVQIEDDAVLKPDALRLALWYQGFQENNQETLLMSMCNHRAFGKNQLGGSIPEDDPELIAETPYVTSPFAWATTASNWGFLRKWWGFKKVAPTAWSFSLSMAMRMNKKIGLHPVLSRCENVGKFGGYFETPESFDQTQSGLIYREEPYEGEYDLRIRMDREDLKYLDSWMRDELIVRGIEETFEEKNPSQSA